MSESLRQQKVSRLIQKEIGQIIQIGGIQTGGALITVTVVRISPDLSFARVYVSIFPADKRVVSMDLIKQQSSEIRKKLGNNVRHQLRIVPELSFFLDDSLDDALRIEELLKK